ncbi:iron-containing redox enzyme family protein [Legionella spiritensis]|uniref:iron-containing redox enzyme family protein n=1 Tax=Legionella spiritensis TaxID=452 RepID=UPI000F6EA810|nr:iron-containing redox enzyme family protein [Legionella spiritensis]VEG90377.1 Pyrroloquinoline quinone (Coenzyme PQQ) biosynthesis protein C [Legionella spiritensis]
MAKNPVINIPASLSQFLSKADADYKKSLASIPLFNPQKTRTWNHDQKKYFAAVFYHLRGHFINFMWYVANFSSNEQTKQIIINNIHEELGIGTRFSHELLYERFATQCGVDIHSEIVSETHYTPFAREFNKSHLQWLTCHDEDERIAAFAAYERLDNLDYPDLLELARSLSLPQSALTFFNVHVYVEHFDSTIELLLPIWHDTPEKLKSAFDFIYSHQYKMWRNLSDSVFSLVDADCRVA